MAKKIRFPLIMEDGTECREFKTLKEHFSMKQVLDYISNGKLVLWLKDRSENAKANEIEKLDPNSPDLSKQIYKIIFETVAFSQDDLYDLLDEGHRTIYLYGDKFEIPLNHENMTYIGYNDPIVIINSTKKIDWKEKNINLKKVQFDDDYKKILEFEEQNTGEPDDTDNSTIDVEIQKLQQKFTTFQIEYIDALCDDMFSTKLGGEMGKHLILKHIGNPTQFPAEVLTPILDAMQLSYDTQKDPDTTIDEITERLTQCVEDAQDEDAVHTAFKKIDVLLDTEILCNALIRLVPPSERDAAVEDLMNAIAYTVTMAIIKQDEKLLRICTGTVEEEDKDEDTIGVTTGEPEDNTCGWTSVDEYFKRMIGRK